MTSAPDWPLGLACMAHALSRDLQRASRMAGGPERLWRGSAADLVRWLRVSPAVADRAMASRDGFRPGAGEQDAPAQRAQPQVEEDEDRHPHKGKDNERVKIEDTMAVTSTLIRDLAARISVNARHNTSPPAGVKRTDTLSKVSLVYAF